MKKTRSHTYFKTVLNDKYAEETINAIRDGAIAFNLFQKAQSLTTNDSTFVRQTKRVDVFGRLGKNNPHSNEYKVSSKRNPYQRVNPKHAASFDIYVTTTKIPLQ